MNRRYSIVGGIFFSCLLLISLVLFIHYRYQQSEDVRCSSLFKADLAMDASKKLLVDAVIDFQRTDDEALLLIKGSALSDSGKTTLSRELVLSKKHEDNHNGFEYLVKQINKGPTDNTPESIFNELVGEISVDNKHVFLDDAMERNDAILIRGPYSRLFMCVRY